MIKMNEFVFRKVKGKKFNIIIDYFLLILIVVFLFFI